MEIKTKFNLNDTLYTINNHKIASGKVKEINTETKEKDTEIKYWCEGENGYFFAYDKYSFSTKEELIKSL